MNEKTDYKAMTEYLDRLTEKYESLSVTTLGTSLMDRRIPLICLGSQKNCRSVLYVASHHASECICTEVLLRFVAEYCERLKGNSSVCRISVKQLWESCDIFIVPMLNPDGVELHLNGVSDDNPMKERLLRMNGGDDFTHWQANGRGVDLNHNYDAGFKEYKILERQAGIRGGCATRFSGEYPESEPEVGYLCNFIRFNSSIRAAITLHTQGEEIYYTSGDKILPRSQTLASLISKLTGYRVAKPEGMASYGGMTDWMIQKIKKPSFTVECGKGENPLPASCGFEIYSRLREMLFTFPLMA